MIVGNPAWRVLDQDGVLVVTGGADEICFVDDVPGSVAAELAACWSAQPPTRDQLSPDARRAVTQLEPLGVLTPRVRLAATPVLGFEGDDVGLAPLVTDLLGWPTEGPTEFGIWVRASSPWRDASTGNRLNAGTPHLIVDLAASHTIAIGPLVIPGHTSCVSCLAGRVAMRWGDPEPPSAPGAAARPALEIAAGLVAWQAQQVVQGNYALANRTASLDLTTLASTISPVLPSASCPQCGDLGGDGRVRLPWA